MYPGSTTSTHRSSECTSLLPETRCLFSSLVNNQLRNRLVSEKKRKYTNIFQARVIRVQCEKREACFKRRATTVLSQTGSTVDRLQHDTSTTWFQTSTLIQSN